MADGTLLWRLQYLAETRSSDEGILLARRLLEQEPENALAHALLGLFTFRVGDEEAGLDALRRSVTLDPECHRAHYSLALCLAARGEPAGAIEALREAIRSQEAGSVPGVSYRVSAPMELEFAALAETPEFLEVLADEDGFVPHTLVDRPPEKALTASGARELLQAVLAETGEQRVWLVAVIDTSGAEPYLNLWGYEAISNGLFESLRAQAREAQDYGFLDGALRQLACSSFEWSVASFFPRWPDVKVAETRRLIRLLEDAAAALPSPMARVDRFLFQYVDCFELFEVSVRGSVDEAEE